MQPSSTASEKPLSGSADQVKEVRSQSSYGGRPSYGIDSTVSSASLETGRPFDIQQSKEEFNIRAYQKQGIGEYPSESRTMSEKVHERTNIFSPSRYSFNANYNLQLESFGIADRFKPQEEKKLKKLQLEVETLRLKNEAQKLLYQKEVQQRAHEQFLQKKTEEPGKEKSETQYQVQSVDQKGIQAPRALQQPKYQLLSSPPSVLTPPRENGAWAVHPLIVLGMLGFAGIGYPIISAFVTSFAKKSIGVGEYLADLLFPEPMDTVPSKKDENPSENEREQEPLEINESFVNANQKMLGTFFVACRDVKNQNIRKGQIAKCISVNERTFLCGLKYYKTDPVYHMFDDTFAKDIELLWYRLPTNPEELLKIKNSLLKDSLIFKE